MKKWSEVWREGRPKRKQISELKQMIEETSKCIEDVKSWTPEKKKEMLDGRLLCGDRKEAQARLDGSLAALERSKRLLLNRLKELE